MSQYSDARIFIEVVKAGSMTKAASHLGFSRSYVSRVIKELEQRLGVPLLNRNTRNLSLTPPGERYHSRCVAAFELLDDAEKSVMEEQLEPGGLLRISMPASFGVRLFARVVALFQAQYESIQVEAEYTDRTVDIIAEGVDVAIRVGSLEDSELIARKLFTIDWLTVANPKYLKDFGTPTSPKELESHSVLMYQAHRQGRGMPFTKGDQLEWSKVSGRMATNHGDAILEAALQGLGIAFQPRWVANPYLKSKQLQVLLEDWSLPDTHVWAVTPPKRHKVPKVSAWLKFLQAQLKKQEWEKSEFSEP